MTPGAALILISGMIAQSPSTPADDPAPALAKYAKELLEAHNRERAAQKLPPLTLDDRLNRAAEAHARDMALMKVMSHEGSDKSHPVDRIERQKYHYVLVGENVAQGQEDVKSVMKAWMDSPPHRENILGKFSQMGAAVFQDTDRSYYWSVEFGTPIPKLVPAEAAKDLLERINKVRADEKKPTLTLSPKLERAAMSTAQGLAKRKALEHEEVDADRFVKAEGYRYETLAQSIAAGAPTAEIMLSSILKSDDQKAQYLGEFTDIGIGYAQDDEEKPFWCILFAKPLRRR